MQNKEALLAFSFLLFLLILPLQLFAQGVESGSVKELSSTSFDDEGAVEVNETDESDESDESHISAIQLKSTLQKINWKAVQGAYLYRFIIKDEQDRVLSEKELKINSLQLYLRPGNYMFKVQVINRFKKVAAETPWTPFKVLPAIQPIIRSISQTIFYDNSEFLDFTLRVDNATEESEILFFQSKNHYQPDSSMVKLNKKRSGYYYQLKIPVTQLQYGLFSIRITNPSGLQTKLIDAFELRQAIAPLPDKLSLTKGYSSEVYQEIQLTGNQFEKGIQIRLEGDSDIVIADLIRFISSTEIFFSFNLEGAKHGTYHLVVENPSGLETVLENSFEVLTYDIASLLDFSFSYKMGGYVDPYLSQPEFFYTGAQFRFGFGFGNLAFYDKPFLKDLGVEFELTTWFAPSDENVNNIFLLLTGFNFFWQSNFDSPANIQIKLGTGLTYANMPEGVTDGYYTQTSYTPYIKLGVNGIFEPVDKLLIDIGFAAIPIIYFDRTAWIIEFGIGLGGSL